jgi:hypothetical protein
VPVCIAPFVDDDGSYPVTLRVDSDAMTVEQAERLAAVLTEQARRLREITHAVIPIAARSVRASSIRAADTYLFNGSLPC